jgi:hypothetical protein
MWLIAAIIVATLIYYYAVITEEKGHSNWMKEEMSEQEKAARIHKYYKREFESSRALKRGDSF